MHVCLLTSGRVFEIAYGGEEKFTIALANWLLKNKQEVTLIGSTFMGIKAKKLESTINVTAEKDRNGHKNKPKLLYPPYYIYSISRLILVILWILKLVKLNMRDHIDLIHCQDTGYGGLAGIIFGKMAGIPVIITSHSIRHKVLDSTLTGRFNKIICLLEYHLDKFSVSKADKIVAVSKPIKDYYTRLVNRRIDVLPIPVKLDEFYFSDIHRGQVRSDLGVSEKEILLGYVGRFAPIKNLFLLIDAFQSISKKNELIKLLLVGGGLLESDIKSYVKSTGSNNKVIFYGISSDVGKVLPAIDIFILPSFSEGLPTSLIEAMACSRAVICSDIPAHREMVKHGYNGLLFDVHKVRELETAILGFLDEKSRNELGDRALASVLKFNESNVFAGILSYYFRILEGR